MNSHAYSAPTRGEAGIPAFAAARRGPAIPPGDVLTANGQPHGCSRRRFVAQSLLTVAAAPMLVREVAALAVAMPASADRQGGGAAAGTANGSGFVHAAGAFDNRLATKVYINGRGPYSFLVDTGAERTLIAAEVAVQLALPRGRRVLVEGIIRDQPAVLVQIASLRMGSLVCPPLEVPVLPHKLLEADGYLGLDVLDKHRVVLDFRAGTLSVMRPQGFFAAMWEHWDEAVVHTLGSSGRLRASDCKVGDVRAAAFIDTGAEVSVANPALYAALQQTARDRLLARGSVGLYGITGGSVIGLATNIKDIRLGELHLTYTPFVVAPLEVFDVWGLRREPALLLGMDCLRRFARVSIDYGRKELRFEVASARTVQPLEAGLPPPLEG
ncbi:MAG TPA: retroviral-like aspartic protease family protein [Steroidobacteraceae bacterium]|nr:retroviral-like aspartic protease family protein [Steroidobacteraceae bacterium]